MARFRGIVQGSRDAVSRLGGKAGGLDVSANGWRVGVRVQAHVDDNDRDVFEVFATGGSSPAYAERHIATVTLDDDGLHVRVSD